MSLTMIEIATSLLGLTTWSTTTERHVLRSWRTHAAATFDHGILCCYCYG